MRMATTRMSTRSAIPKWRSSSLCSTPSSQLILEPHNAQRDVQELDDRTHLVDPRHGHREPECGRSAASVPANLSPQALAVVLPMKDLRDGPTTTG